MSSGPHQSGDRPVLSGVEFAQLAGVTVAAAFVSGLLVMSAFPGSGRLLPAALLAVAVGLVPLRLLCRAVVMSVPTIWMASMLIRMTAAVVVLVGLLMQGLGPVAAVVAMVLTTYLVSAFVEAAWLARLVWER